MSATPPKIPACFLYEKTDARGQRYLKGRMGGLTVLIVPNKPNKPDGAPFLMHFAAPFPELETKDHNDA